MQHLVTKTTNDEADSSDQSDNDSTDGDRKDGERSSASDSDSVCGEKQFEKPGTTKVWS